MPTRIGILPRLVGLWDQIAARYKDRPAGVIFELYNEPHDKLTDARWNAALVELLRVVRKTNPTRPVIVGPVQWNSIRALDRLELPKEDRNLIVTIHFYDPFEFTHQGAAWVTGADRWKGRTWTGTEAEQSAIRKSFERAAEWGKKHDRPIFLGEFGAYEEAELAAHPAGRAGGPRGRETRLQLGLLGILRRIWRVRPENRTVARRSEGRAPGSVSALGRRHHTKHGHFRPGFLGRCRSEKANGAIREGDSTAAPVIAAKGAEGTTLRPCARGKAVDRRRSRRRPGSLRGSRLRDCGGLTRARTKSTEEAFRS